MKMRWRMRLLALLALLGAVCFGSLQSTKAEGGCFGNQLQGTCFNRGCSGECGYSAEGDCFCIP